MVFGTSLQRQKSKNGLLKLKGVTKIIAIYIVQNKSVLVSKFYMQIHKGNKYVLVKNVL